MSQDYDIRDDMLQCFCGNTPYEHYYNPYDKKIIYFPNNSINQKKTRCLFFFNNSNKNKCSNPYCNFIHTKDNEIPINYNFNKNIDKTHKLENGKYGWETKESNEQRDQRRINRELPKLKSNLTIDVSDEILKYEPTAPKYSPVYTTPTTTKFFNSTSTFQYSPTAPTTTKFFNSTFQYSPTAPKYSNTSYININSFLGKRKNNSEDIEIQPRLNPDSEWYERRSRHLIFNNEGIIYYVHKYSGKKTWINPITGKTNLPGNNLTPSSAGLIIS